VFVRGKYGQDDDEKQQQPDNSSSIQIYRNMYTSILPSVNVAVSVQFRVPSRGVVFTCQNKATREHVNHPTCIEFTVRSAAEEAQDKQIKLRLGHFEGAYIVHIDPAVSLLLLIFVSYRCSVVC
jgi:hypothetical protein